MTRAEELEYEFYLIHVKGCPYPEQIIDKEFEDELLLERVAEYKGGYADEYVFKG
jgi:hypothetical protein